MRFLNRLLQRLPRRDLFGKEGIYLSRHTVARLGFVRVYLNHFHRGDEDKELHNHPWRWAVSIILSGGYREERRYEDCGSYGVESRVLRPGNLNVILADTFHRVDDVKPDTWTLFVVGPRVQDWGFWNRWLGTFTPWRDFIHKKGLPIT